MCERVLNFPSFGEQVIQKSLMIAIKELAKYSLANTALLAGGTEQPEQWEVEKGISRACSLVGEPERECSLQENLCSSERREVAPATSAGTTTW